MRLFKKFYIVLGDVTYVSACPLFRLVIAEVIHISEILKKLSS